MRLAKVVLALVLAGGLAQAGVVRFVAKTSFRTAKFGVRTSKKVVKVATKVIF